MGASAASSAAAKARPSPPASAAASAAPEPVASSPTPATSISAAASAAAPGPAAPYKPDTQRYAWLGDDRDFPKPDASLETRFPTPPGYARVKVEAGSFAEWLRSLP